MDGDSGGAAIVDAMWREEDYPEMLVENLDQWLVWEGQAERGDLS